MDLTVQVQRRKQKKIRELAGLGLCVQNMAISESVCERERQRVIILFLCHSKADRMEMS